MVTTQVFYTDFNSGTPSQFSGFVNTESVQGYNGLGSGGNSFSGNFLRNTSGGHVGGGGFLGAPQIRTTLTLTGLPAHNSIDLNFLLAVVDSWDGLYSPNSPGQGDFFNVSINGNTIFSEAFNNDDTGDQTYVPPTGVFLGKGQFAFNGGYTDSAYNLGLDPKFNNIPHTSSTLTIQWYADGAGWEGGDNESWAIDNVSVILNSNSIPIPQSPKISISNVTIFEGNSGVNNAFFNVTLNQASSKPITVNYATSNGSAVAGSDYTAKLGVLTFNPGQTKKNIIVPIKTDTLKEANETFRVNLSNPKNATLQKAVGLGTILNDDIPPKLSIKNVSLFEGNSGTKKAIFTVTLTGKAVNAVSVNYATANGNAIAGSDYIPVAGKLYFPRSNSYTQSKTIAVNVKGDTLLEGNEVFYLNLRSQVNAELTNFKGQATIRNDDDLNKNQLVTNNAIASRNSQISRQISFDNDDSFHQASGRETPRETVVDFNSQIIASVDSNGVLM